MKLRFLFSFLFLITFLNCYAQQEIVLIGTMHNGSPGGQKDIEPLRLALEKFRPQVVCVEYPLGRDTASILWRFGPKHYIKQDSLMKEWQLPKNLNDHIDAILKQSTLSTDILQLMKLFSLYYVSSDFGNSDYQAFRIMELTDDDSSKHELIKNHPAFEFLAWRYYKRFVYKEYPSLVFPLASNMNIVHVYAIDDLSAMSDGNKDLETMSEEVKKKYQANAAAYTKRLKELPEGTNQLLFLNSEEVIRSTYEALKILPAWVIRNKKMAGYIHAATKANPGKRVVVFFGAGHIGQIIEELLDLDKSYRVLTLTDIMK
jgi:hypothetical protein